MSEFFLRMLVVFGLIFSVLAIPHIIGIVYAFFYERKRREREQFNRDE